MSFMKKLFNTAIVTGAAVGGALYLKKRKEERENNADFEDSNSCKNEKVVEFSKENEDGKVSITFNTKKIKSTANKAADKVLDATEKAKDVVTEKIGEENMEKVKETAQTVKEKAKDVAEFAMDKASDAKDFVVETIGEENIDTVKEKVTDLVDTAKDKVYSTFGSDNDSDDFEDDFVEDIDDFKEVKTTTATTVNETDFSEVPTSTDASAKPDVSEVTTEDDVFLDEELEEI